jgi:hypothetical protein
MICPCPFPPCSERFDLSERLKFVRHLTRKHRDRLEALLTGSRNRPVETLKAEGSIESLAAGSSVVAHRGTRDGP